MPDVQREFQRRAAEIEAYFDHIAAVEEGSVSLVTSGADVFVDAYSAVQREDLLRTFKASAFLILYNIMEATVKNAVEAIFDELTTRGVSFDACRREVRRVVLRNLKSCDNQDHLKARSVSEAVDLFGDLARDSVARTFQREKVVSGNVDSKQIRELADQYGFLDPAGNGSGLLRVKTTRNSLAHGDQSFSEVGRDVTLTELLAIKTGVMSYLSRFIVNVTDYLHHQHYLSAPGRP